MIHKQRSSLHKGSYYYIINVETGLALSMPQKSVFSKQTIISELYDPENINQVWMIEQVQPETFQIVHALSTLVVQNQNTSCKLQFGKQKNSQLYQIVQIEQHSKVMRVWIKDKKKSLKHLHWNGSKLKFMEIDCSDKLTQWDIIPVKYNSFIDRTCFISSVASHNCLDVPEASEKIELQIIQYSCNHRFNQRWMLERVGDCYSIKNAKTNLYLDIKSQSHKEGMPIIQYPYNGNKNQLWKLEEQGKHLYLIRSAMDNQLLMGVRDNSLKQGMEIITTKNDTSAFWRITGFIPA